MSGFILWNWLLAHDEALSTHIQMRVHAVMAALSSPLSSLIGIPLHPSVLMGGVITGATGRQTDFIVCGKPAGSCPLVGKNRNTCNPSVTSFTSDKPQNLVKKNACTRTDVDT